jgi:diguanylate cyclase (GGDEF)-like protein
LEVVMDETERGRELRTRFAAERRRGARTTAIVGGSVAVIGLPAWSLFDVIMDPANAGDFIRIRLIAVCVILAALIALFTRAGERRPEPFVFLIAAAVQVSIAAMIVQLEDHHAAYALGMSLAIYASGFLFIWGVAYTVALGLMSLGALAVGWLLTPEPVDAGTIATVCFYLVTASVVAVCGGILRDRAAWSEFQTRADLEAEQAANRKLLGELDRLSYEDSLTGLANRRAWDRAIERECARARRAGTALAVILCDVDRLKEINDSLGHAMGDVVLRAVADLLRARTRSADLVARIGGDEFAILLSNTDLLGAASLAEEIRKLVEIEQPGGNALGPSTVSLGAADWEAGDDSAAALMLRADRRLYAAKAKRNIVCAGDPAEHVSAD